MKNVILIGSMLVAVGMITGAYIYAEGVPIKNLQLSNAKKDTSQVIERNRPDFDVNPTRSEHAWIRGSESASITIVEFSDFECVFCKRLHPTLVQLLEEYPDQVNWEFRHLPLVIHINARNAALAAECVGELAGNDAFWIFSDFLFENQRNFGSELYVEGARMHGITPDDLQACMERPDIGERLLADEQIAMAVGASGTPYNMIVYADGSTKPVVGALPLEEWVKLIQQ